MEIDGGSSFVKLIAATLPMMSPLILQSGNGAHCILQTFTQGYVMTNGGPESASNFTCCIYTIMLLILTGWGWHEPKADSVFGNCADNGIIVPTSGWVYYGGDTE